MKSSDIQTIENAVYDSGIFDIRWRMTTLCNYQCDFCIQGSREEHLRQAQGESSQLREQICRKLVELIENLKPYRGVKVGLIGGEVTMLEDFPRILKAISCSRFRGEITFCLTTNFSAGSDYFRRLCDIIQGSAHDRSLHISASFYPAYTSLEAFTKKLREIDAYIRENGYHRWPASLLAGRRNHRKIFLNAGIPIICDSDYDVFLKMRTAFEGSNVGIAPIIIRNYRTEISDHIARELLENERKKIRVTDGDGKESCFQNIQALGMALEDRESFCPAGYLCDAGIHNI